MPQPGHPADSPQSVERSSQVAALVVSWQQAGKNKRGARPADQQSSRLCSIFACMHSITRIRQALSARGCVRVAGAANARTGGTGTQSLSQAQRCTATHLHEHYRHAPHVLAGDVWSDSRPDPRQALHSAPSWFSKMAARSAFCSQPQAHSSRLRRAITSTWRCAAVWCSAQGSYGCGDVACWAQQT